jgi:hypothetical protein
MERWEGGSGDEVAERRVVQVKVMWLALGGPSAIISIGERGGGCGGRVHRARIERWEVVEVVMSWPGLSAVEREAGAGGGDVAGSRWTLRT